jgi:L-ascorbate metabolism protein UlaG (beta-lactamase superfamily)
MAHDITLRYLGHSAFQIRHGRFDLLIDPFLTDNPCAAVKAAELDPTHILVTHGHGDHLGDTVAIAKRTGCQVITVHEIAEWLTAKGIDAWGMGAGGGHTFDFGRVTTTLAHHSSSFDDGSYAGNPVGFVLQLDGRAIYHAGDTALFLDMELIGRRFALDVALLPIGDNYTMGVADAVMAVEMLKPKLTIPMHYGTFPPIAADPDDLRDLLEAKGFGVAILAPGEEHVLR